MAPQTAWKGAIEFKVKGFPVPVNVRLYGRVSSKRPEGFVLLSPANKPVAQMYIEDGGKWKGTVSECARGVKVGKEVKPIDAATIESIGKTERSATVEPDSFAPMETIDLTLAKSSYYVVPEDDTAARSAQVIWNGLLTTELAYVTRIVMRAGSADQIIAIYADEGGLKAVGLPWEAEINDEPVCDWQRDDAVGEMFREVIEQGDYAVRPFDPAEHPSEHRERRAALLAQFLAGQTIQAPTEPETAAEGPDLLSLLTASVEEAKPKPRRKPRAKREKVAA